MRIKMWRKTCGSSYRTVSACPYILIQVMPLRSSVRTPRNWCTSKDGDHSSWSFPQRRTKVSKLSSEFEPAVPWSNRSRG